MITIRTYEREVDYEKINQFLLDVYEPEEEMMWVQPQWEFIHYHPHTRKEALQKIGIFEREGKILAVVTHDGTLGDAFFLIHPKHHHLKAKLIQYAEDNLGKTLKNGKLELSVYIKEGDKRLERFVNRRRYKSKEEAPFENIQSSFLFDTPIPSVKLKEGYTLNPLTDVNDWKKLSTLFKAVYKDDENWLSFHKAPSFDVTLGFVIVNEKGDYLSYAQGWFNEKTGVAYINPVCTHPKHRRKGLASICVYEIIKALRDRTTTKIISGSSHPFFLNLGFQTIEGINKWTKQY